jgi:hypothetical protein
MYGFSENFFGSGNTALGTHSGTPAEASTRHCCGRQVVIERGSWADP